MGGFVNSVILFIPESSSGQRCEPCSYKRHYTGHPPLQGFRRKNGLDLRHGEVEEGCMVERSVGIISNRECHTAGRTGAGGDVGGSNAEIMMWIDTVGGRAHKGRRR